MVTRRPAGPHWPGLVRLVVASALVGTALACNALLDNEPRVFSPSSGQGGEAGAEEPRNGGTAGEDAAGAGGESAAGKGGAGESATSDGGAAGDAGSPSEGGESGSTPAPCELTTAKGCSPGGTEAQAVACACGGTKQQIRTCSDTCSWGAWMDTTACDLTCCTTVVYCNTQESMVASEFPGRGTWCRQMACSRAEADTDCLASAESVCGGIAPNLYMEYH